MNEKCDFDVVVEEKYKYIGHQQDGPRSIGKYEKEKDAVRAGLEFQMDHQDYGFRVFYKEQEMVCQPAPSR